MTFSALTVEQIWTLLGAFGGTVVVLYILKLRRRQIRVPFGPLWARVLQTEQTSALFRALKRIISLLIQLCVVTLLVLALAHPSLPLGQLRSCNGQVQEAPEIEPSFTLLAVDTSVSMNATDVPSGRFGAALAAARRVLLDRVDGESIMVAGLDTRFRPYSPFSTNVDFLTQQLLRLYPTDAGSDIANTVQSIRDVLSGKSNARVVFITDGSLEWPNTEILSGLKVEQYFVGPNQATKNNMALVKLHVRPYLDDSLNYELYYEVKNYSDERVQAALLLYANPDGRTKDDYLRHGVLVRSEPLELEPNQVITGFIPNVEYPGNRLMGRVVPAENSTFKDVLPTDDVAYGLVPERKRLRIQLVTDENYYLEAVLFVRENLSYVRVAPDDFRGTEGFDVTIFDRFVPSAPVTGNALFIGPQTPGGPVVTDGTVSLPELTDVNVKHPLNWKVSLVDLNIGTMLKLVPGPDDKVVIRSSDGDPAVVISESKELRAVVWAFDVRQSDLPLRYAFPIMVINTLRWFHQEDDSLLTGRRVGQDWAIPINTQAASVLVTTPSGTAIQAPIIDQKAVFFGDQMGVYDVAANNKITSISGNFVSQRESNLEATKTDLPPWNPRQNTVYQRSTPSVLNDWQTKDLWKLCLLVALAIIGLEWATYHRRWTV